MAKYKQNVGTMMPKISPQIIIIMMGSEQTQACTVDEKCEITKDEQQ